MSLGFAAVCLGLPPQPVPPSELVFSILYGGGSPWATAGALHPCGELTAYDSGRIFCEFPMPAEPNWIRVGLEVGGGPAGL